MIIKNELLSILKTDDMRQVDEYIKRNNLSSIRNSKPILKYLIKCNELNTLKKLVDNCLDIKKYIFELIEKAEFLSLTKLLSIGIDFDFEDKHGYSPYLLAHLKKDLHIISLFESYNVGSNYSINEKIHNIILRNNEDIALIQITDLLTKNYQLLSCVDENFNSPLITSIFREYNDLSRYLIAQGIDIYKRNKDLATAIYYVIEHSNLCLFKLLINNQKVLESSCFENKIPLYVIIMKDKLQLFEILVNQTNINILIHHESLVEIAVQHNAVEITDYLVQNGADLNYTSNIFKQSPFIIACKYGYKQIALKLLDGNVNKNYVDGFNKRAIDYAIENKLDAIIKRMTK